MIEIIVNQDYADTLIQDAYEDVEDYEFIDNEHVYTLESGQAVIIPSVIVLSVNRVWGLA